MNKATTAMNFAVVLLIPYLSLCSAQAQRSLESHRPQDTCAGPVFSGKQITQRAKIISRSIPNLTPEAQAHDLHGVVELEAVLCRTGRVTDVKVIKGLPYGMTAAAVESLQTIRFKPAEMNWHTVSQRMQFEFAFGDGLIGIDEIPLDRAAGRLIERLEVIGNRSIEEKQIMQWVSTRAGDNCSVAKLQHDLDAILKTGYFDKRKTRLYAGEGTHGEVVIYFSVVELPLITEIKIEGLKDSGETSILEAMLSENLDLRAGAVYEPEKIRNAVSVINKVLQLKGHRSATVEVWTESLSTQKVKLRFVVSGID